MVENGIYTHNTTEGTISRRFDSLNERRRVESAVIDPKIAYEHT